MDCQASSCCSASIRNCLQPGSLAGCLLNGGCNRCALHNKRCFQNMMSSWSVLTPWRKRAKCARIAYSSQHGAVLPSKRHLPFFRSNQPAFIPSFPCCKFFKCILNWDGCPNAGLCRYNHSESQYICHSGRNMLNQPQLSIHL